MSFFLRNPTTPTAQQSAPNPSSNDLYPLDATFKIIKEPFIGKATDRQRSPNHVKAEETSESPILLKTEVLCSLITEDDATSPWLSSAGILVS